MTTKSKDEVVKEFLNYVEYMMDVEGVDDFELMVERKKYKLSAEEQEVLDEFLEFS